MNEEIKKHNVKCPYPDCDGLLNVRENLPAGEYLCECHYCTVKLSWAVYLQGGNKPYLTLVEKAPETPRTR